MSTTAHNCFEDAAEEEVLANPSKRMRLREMPYKQSYLCGREAFAMFALALNIELLDEEVDEVVIKTCIES